MRGNLNSRIAPADHHNPSLGADIIGRTGRSRGPGTPVPVEFAAHRNYSAYALLEMEAWGERESMDPADVGHTFLDAIGAGSGVERVMMLVWRDAGLPIVEREAPRVTGGGKILHVHLERPSRLSVGNAD